MQELREQKRKVCSEIVKRRKQDRDECESLLDLYMRAMETAPAGKAAK